MGISYNPRIVTDGLVLALDAGNTKGFDDDENLMTNSQLGTTILNDGGGVTLTTDTTIVNPFGEYDGVLKCVHTTQTPGYFRRGQNMSLTAGVTYTFSVFFKNGTVANPYGVANPNTGPGLQVTTFTPTFQELNTSLNTNIPFPNGWYRQVFTFTPSYNQTYQVDFNQAVNQTPLGTYYLYGFQLERGSTVSPYYATTASAKNRGTILTDLTGRGNNGTLTNSPTYSSANGGSIVFDGVDDYGVINDNSDIKPVNQITVSTFIYPTLTSYSNCRIFGDWHQNSGIDRWILYANGSSISWYMRTQTTGEGGTTGWTIINNQWVSLTGVYDGTNQDLYVNGNFFSRRPCSGIMNSGNGSTPIRFGRQETTGGGFQGNIAQASIYNRALTAAEIQQNFNTLRGRYGI